MKSWFTVVEPYMGKKIMKRCSISQVIGEMEIETNVTSILQNLEL